MSYEKTSIEEIIISSMESAMDPFPDNDGSTVTRVDNETALRTYRFHDRVLAYKNYCIQNNCALDTETSDLISFFDSFFTAFLFPFCFFNIFQKYNPITTVKKNCTKEKMLK